MNTKSIFSILIAFIMLSTIASAVEIRGTVIEVTGSKTYTWTANEFAGFQYDIDNNVSGESMSVSVDTSRSISENNLIYSTQKTLITKPNHPTYSVVGWMGDKYVAVGGKANKMAKLVLDMGDDEKLTGTQGSALTLGAGYVLKIQEVDAKSSPRQAWFQLLKDGNIIDDGIVNEKQNYSYSTTVLGDADTPVFKIYIQSIFSGTEVSMIQMKYGWLIDTSSAKEVKVGDTYGSMKVIEASTEKVVLKNSNSISLSKNSEVTVMGNMKFKVANSDTLRFYPKIDMIGNTISIITPTTTPVIVTPTPTPVNCTNTEKIIYRDVIVTVTVTPEPTPEPTVTITPTSSIPGFEGIFAITGLLAVAYIVLRQRK